MPLNEQVEGWRQEVNAAYATSLENYKSQRVAADLGHTATDLVGLHPVEASMPPRTLS